MVGGTGRAVKRKAEAVAPGQRQVSFERPAPTLKEAVAAAARDVRKAGWDATLVKVERARRRAAAPGKGTGPGRAGCFLPFPKG